ncbi:MAG: hypothetical protein HYV78_02340 [Candidatus Wildermuthbacteria bacterium]|nr:hypothetical protein [Candidatus Wildermuthbacteria bacterium]
MRKKRVWWKQKTLWAAGGAVAVLALIFSLIAFADFFQIYAIRVEGTKLISAEKLRSKIDEFLSRKAGFATTRSIFLVSKADVRSRVLQEFPELAALSLDKTLPNTLFAVAQERIPSAVWCAASGGQCFLADKEGIAYKELDGNAFVEWSSQLPVLHDSLGANSMKAGAKAIDAALLEALLKFRDGTSSVQLAGGEALSFVSFDFLSAERVRAVAKEGWDAYINPEENLAWQSVKLKAVLEKKIPAESRRFLEYIDLRFGDQAYIKYKSNIKN